MAFSESWDETAPDGATVTVSQVDDHIRSFKEAVRERLEGDAADANTGIFQSGSFSTAPKIKELRGKTGIVTNVTYGHDGDANTGVNIPANDQVDLVVGGTAVVHCTTGGMTVLLGGSTSYGDAVGIANVSVADSANSGAAETDLWTYSLPADAFNVNGKMVHIRAWGSLAANGNLKTINLYCGASSIICIGTVTSTENEWVIDAYIAREDATNAKYSVLVSTEEGLNVPGRAGTFGSQTWTGATTIKLTGQGTSNNDIVLEAAVVEFLN